MPYAGFLVALQSPALRLFFTRGVQSQDLAAQAEPAFACAQEGMSDD